MQRNVKFDLVEKKGKYFIKVIVAEFDDLNGEVDAVKFFRDYYPWNMLFAACISRKVNNKVIRDNENICRSILSKEVSSDNINFMLGKTILKPSNIYGMVFDDYDILYLRYHDKLTNDEIADLRGTSSGKVYTIITNSLFAINKWMDYFVYDEQNESEMRVLSSMFKRIDDYFWYCGHYTTDIQQLPLKVIFTRYYYTNDNYEKSTLTHLFNLIVRNIYLKDKTKDSYNIIGEDLFGLAPHEFEIKRGLGEKTIEYYNDIRNTILGY